MPVSRPADERFWGKVDTSGGEDACWPWLAHIDKTNGYGRFWLGRTAYAHRFAYETFVGPIPDGMELDHLCRNRACANPAHLEPVTHAENMRRSDGGKYWAAKTHCPQGHPYDEENTYVYGGSRNCIACRRERDRARRLARRFPNGGTDA